MERGEKMEENNNYYYQASPPPPQNETDGVRLENRNIALCIVLSIVTCGIYMWYWLYKLVNDLSAASRDSAPTSGGMVLVLTLITCNIYGWFWLYKAGQQMNAAKQQRGLPADPNAGVIYLVLAIFGLNVVSYAIIQNDLNTMAAMNGQN